MWTAIAWNGLCIAALCVLFLTYDPVRMVWFAREVPNVEGGDTLVFLTAFFAFFIFSTVFSGVSLRVPDSLNIFDHLLQNSGFLSVVAVIFGVQISFSWLFGKLLRTTALTVSEWLLVIALASVMVPIDALRKMVVLPSLGTKENMEDPQAYHRGAKSQ